MKNYIYIGKVSVSDEVNYDGLNKILETGYTELDIIKYSYLIITVPLSRNQNRELFEMNECATDGEDRQYLAPSGTLMFHETA